MVSGFTGSIPMTSTMEVISPRLAAFHIPPAFAVLNTPPQVPAYSVPGWSGSMDKVSTRVSVRPLLTGLQLLPPLVLLNTPAEPPIPLKTAPAYTMAGVVGLTATRSGPPGRPLVSALQLVPPLVLLNTPPS